MRNIVMLSVTYADCHVFIIMLNVIMLSVDASLGIET